MAIHSKKSNTFSAIQLEEIFVAFKTNYLRAEKRFSPTGVKILPSLSVFETTSAGISYTLGIKLYVRFIHDNSFFLRKDYRESTLYGILCSGHQHQLRQSVT